MLLWLAVAHAQTTAEAQADAVQSHVEQARFFIRKQWYEDAGAELEAASKLPDGRIDPEVWYLLATVRYELVDLEGARQAAARAHSYSRTDDQLQLAAGLNAFLTEQFGLVEVRAPYEGLAGRLDLELESVLFDPNLKLYLERLERKVDKRLVFPVRVGLPAGTYQINGEQVVVEPGAERILELDAARLAGGRAPTAQLAKAEIGVGMSFWAGEAVRNLQPAATTEVSLSQPVGPVVAGLTLLWAPTSFATLESTAFSTAPWALGARIGWELPGTGSIVVRPSLGYRYGYLPGIELGCVSDADAWICGSPAEAELVVYGVGRAHVPLAELAVDLLDPGRKSGVGLGVKVTGERAIGMLPREAFADRSSGEAVHYVVSEADRRWSATGARFLLDVSLAF